MAQLCLSVCAVTCLDRSDGQARAAFATWTLMRRSIASRLSLRPVLAGNGGSPGAPRRSAIQARSTATVAGSSGVRRSLRPFPTVCTCAPAPRTMSLMVRAASSEIRSPAWAASTIRA